MIRQFKNGYYTEDLTANVRRGDLLVVDGVVGVLCSDYDPDYLLLVTEKGTVNIHINPGNLRKLKRLQFRPERNINRIYSRVIL